MKAATLAARIAEGKIPGAEAFREYYITALSSPTLIKIRTMADVPAPLGALEDFFPILEVPIVDLPDERRYVDPDRGLTLVFEPAPDSPDAWDLKWLHGPRSAFLPKGDDLYPGIRQDIFKLAGISESPLAHQWFEFCHALTK